MDWEGKGARRAARRHDRCGGAIPLGSIDSPHLTMCLRNASPPGLIATRIRPGKQTLNSPWSKAPSSAAKSSAWPPSSPFSASPRSSSSSPSHASASAPSPSSTNTPAPASAAPGTWSNMPRCRRAGPKKRHGAVRRGESWSQEITPCSLHHIPSLHRPPVPQPHCLLGVTLGPALGHGESSARTGTGGRRRAALGLAAGREASSPISWRIISASSSMPCVLAVR